jgi:required for meiotic nuclear division protein 1
MMNTASNNNESLDQDNLTQEQQRFLDEKIKSLDIRAFLLRTRLDFARIPTQKIIGKIPYTVRLSSSIAVLFRFGVIVFFQFDKTADLKTLFQELEIEELTHLSVTDSIQESWLISCQSDYSDGILNDDIVVEKFSLERIQLAAWAISKSLVLDEFETAIQESFAEVDILAGELQQTGKVRKHASNLLKHIGQVLKAKQQMANRANVIDKPELLWDRPQLESYYHKLEEYLEIRERHDILVRKLDLISSTATTGLELLHTRHSLRLEWYIVILIVVEIVLTLYELFLHP